MRTIFEQTKLGPFLHAERITSTTNGTVVDCEDVEELFLYVSVGTMGGTSPTLDLKVQSGDESDASDAADVTGAAFTQVTTSNDDNIFVGRVLVRGKAKRYYRVVATVGGTSPTIPVSVTGIMRASTEHPETPVTGVATQPSFSV